MVNIVLIWVEVVHKFEGVLVDLHFVPFLFFIDGFQVMIFYTVWFKGMDQVALMPVEGDLGEELTESLCLNHCDQVCLRFKSLRSFFESG